jgi:DNA-binding transcriptional regulator YhcF (GntR family)
MNKADVNLGRINDESTDPKYIQIANRIRELIVGGELSLGDRLPSINQLIEHFSVSRDTVIKAFQELKHQGIVESSPCKAYFVSKVFIQKDLKHVLFLVDDMTPYKERIYHGLVDTLPSGYFVDPVCHDNNFDFLRATYERYRDLPNIAALLVIPTVSQSFDYEYFTFVNPGKLIFIDRKIDGTRHPAVFQEFTDGFYNAMIAERTALSKYTRLTFLTKYYTNAIIEQMIEGLSRFAASVGMEWRHLHAPFTERDMRGKVNPEAGDLFIVLDDLLLIELIRSCDEKSLRIGQDVGIAVVNEGPFYPLLPVPMSVLSTDFYLMGSIAASHIVEGTSESVIVPTKLTVRASM